MGVVIINGQRYDSTTGLLITDEKQPKPTREEPDWVGSFIDRRSSKNTANTNNHATRQIDGVTGTRRRIPVSNSVTHSRHATQASYTLNRRFVRKPISELDHKYKASIVDQEIARAKSKSAQKATAPSQSIDNTFNARESARIKSLSQILQNVQDLEDKKAEQADALARAERETEAAKQKTRRNNKRQAKRKFKMSTILATAGAAAMAVGLGFYIALPTVSFKIAAINAGIDAKQPIVAQGYSASGAVAYEKGKITINYKNHSGNDGYTLTQASSGETGDQLAREAAQQDSGSYTETNAKGKTVYFYNNYASWVDNGIRYTINSNDYLDDNQILDIANSL